MCGVGGIFARPGSPLPRAALDRMQAALDHRGPDGCGMFVEADHPAGPRWGLTHARLAILDLSDAAAQPMRDDGARIVLSYNGEVYNFRELAEELRGLGHRITSTGDTEVVLAAYREWGVACLHRFVGMFSFLLVDESKGLLFAARDPFGIKPLYFSADEDGLSFASEIKALRAARPGGRRADTDSVLRYLRYGATDGGTSTMLADISQLPAGHHLTARLDDVRPSIVKWFDLDVTPQREADLSFETAAAQMRQHLTDSVDLHLRSDVTVGSALSGGLDSSSIVGLIPRITGGRADLHCFTYAATGSPVDETPWARLAADAAGARLHVTAPDARDLLRRLPEVTRSMDEPLPSTSTFAQYCVFELARSQGIKVVLDGQGADEMLAGYDRYVASRVADLVRRGKVLAAYDLARKASARGLRIGDVLLRATDYFVPAWAETAARRMIRREVLPDFVTIEPGKRLTGRGLDSAPIRTRSRSALRDRLAADLTTDTLPSLLRYEDRNSMAWSVESRVPFLTPDLARFCLSLPESYLIAPDGTSKAVLRAAMRGIVPEPILDRTDKIGFAPPANDWFKDMMRFASGHLANAPDLLPFVDRATVVRHAREIEDGSRISEQLWRLVFLAMWTEQCDVRYA